MEKLLKYLEEAEKIIQTTDHLVYVTFPIVKDKKILIKALLETKIAISNCINSILQYEYLYKRIKLYKNPKRNLQTFKEKSSKRYNISFQEIKLIEELFNIIEHHKKSPIEFIKNEKIIILSENMNSYSINIEKIKNFIGLSKNILKKTKNQILR